MFKLFLALRFFRTRRIQILSVICIALGLMVLIIVFSVLEGFQTQLKDAFRRTIPHILMENLEPPPPGADGGGGEAAWEAQFARYAALLEKVPGVVALAPRVETLALMGWATERGPNTFGNEAAKRGVTVVAVDPPRENRVTRFLDMLRELRPPRTAVVTRGGEVLRGTLLGEEGGRLRLRTRRGVRRIPREDVVRIYREPDLRVPDLQHPFAIEPALRGDRRPLTGIIVGEELARHLGLKRGDEVTLITVRLRPGARPGEEDRIVASNMSFYVAGAFRSGMYEQNLFTVYIPLAAGWKLQRQATYAVKIGIATDRFEHAEAVRDACQEALWRRGFMRERLTTWKDRNRSLLAALVVEKRLLTVLMFFLVLMACGTILAILYMMVLEKRRELGILKALGAPVGGLLQLFLLNGGLIGALGSVLGVGLGLLFLKYINDVADFVTAVTGVQVFSPEVYVFDRLPVVYDPPAIVTMASATLLVSVLAAFLPAYVAARADPVRSLRHG